MRSRVITSGAIALCASALVACGSSPGPSTDSSSSQPRTEEPERAGEGSPGVLVTRTATDGRFPLAFLLHGLERRDGLLSLSFSIENRLQSAKDLWSLTNFLGDSKLGDPFTVNGIYLVDRANRKKYLRAYDSNGGCLCTTDASSGHIFPGQRARMFSTFADPPPGVTRLDVVIPNFGTIPNVEIGG